ncbi:transposable element Tcb2 transposase [Trichonephila clavipes]|nr:transposable element Tcb2 transposase [Trichonephila clavipes]
MTLPHGANCPIFHHPYTDSLRASVSVRTIATYLAEGKLLSRRHCQCLLLLTPIHHRLCLEWLRAQMNWTATEWNQAIFSAKLQIHFGTNDNCVRVWRPRGERLNLAFAVQWHTAPTIPMMV